jgi:phage-related protein
MGNARPISWIKAALKEFEEFPDDVQSDMRDAVTLAAEGQVSDKDIWVIHAFQKKSKSGVKTPQAEIDVIRDRPKRLKEALK